MKCAVISFVAISIVWIGLAAYVATARRKPCPTPWTVKVERAAPVPNLRTVRSNAATCSRSSVRPEPEDLKRRWRWVPSWRG